MFSGRKRVIMTALVAAAAVCALVTQISASYPAHRAYKLEGAWIAKVTTFDSSPTPYPFQWTYVLAPDASGRRATLFATVDVGFPSDFEDGSGLHVFGEMVMTGPDTFALNSYFYEVQKGIPTAQIVGIGRAYGEGKFTGPGKSEITYHFEIYDPGADADGDGLPDPGSVPVQTFNVTSSNTRVPSPLLR